MPAHCQVEQIDEAVYTLAEVQAPAAGQEEYGQSCRPQSWPPRNQTTIAHGKHPENLYEILRGGDVGTRFSSREGQKELDGLNPSFTGT